MKMKTPYHSDAINVIKQLKIEDVLTYYGIEIKHGKGHCPFHNDVKTPNLSIKYNRYFCFACGEKGDAIDFVQKYFKLGLKESIAKLNGDFSLGLDMTAPYRPDYRIQSRKRKKQEFDKWCTDFYGKLCAAYRRARNIMFDFDFGNPIIKTAADCMPLLEYYLDILAYGTDEDKQELYMNRKEVAAVAERI